MLLPVNVTRTAISEQDSHRRADLADLVNSRWYALADLGCVAIACALWYVSRGEMSWRPLLIALLPLIGRIAVGQFPIRRTRFDGLFALFLLTAVVGATVAYNPQIAWNKFWLILGAILLFYALAGQKLRNLWPVATAFGLFGTAVALYFLFSHDWQTLPAKVESLNQIGLRWMAIRPSFLAGVHTLHPNVAGGMIAMCFPFLAAAGLHAVRRRRGALVGVMAVSGFLQLTGLTLTTSRGAWIALAGGLLAWCLWWAAEHLHHSLYLSRRQTLALAVAIVIGLGLSYSLLNVGGPLALLDRLPGPANAGSRLEISRQALDLIADFPITGGGLGSFDGLYSRYIRVIPQHVLIHAHNLFLNVMLEQGLVGGAVLIAILGHSFWLIADPSRTDKAAAIRNSALWCGALLSSLGVIALHGLVEDPLYGSRGALLLFATVGLVAAAFPKEPSRYWQRLRSDLNTQALTAAAVFIMLMFLAFYHAPIRAAWYANWGAAQMARAELVGYPTNEWADNQDTAALAPSAANFRRAIQLDNTNRTAWHRLGLIAMQQRDFATAVAHLRNAYTLDENHRGIRKSLAYAYVWSGQLDQAIPLLATIPEATAELDVYAWWWGTKGRDDLSLRASEVHQQLITCLTPPAMYSSPTCPLPTP